MAREQRIESLKKRHADIDTLIQAETSHPAPDISRLHGWKRQKLFIKDQLASLLGDQQAA